MKTLVLLLTIIVVVAATTNIYAGCNTPGILFGQMMTDYYTNLNPETIHGSYYDIRFPTSAFNGCHAAQEWVFKNRGGLLAYGEWAGNSECEVSCPTPLGNSRMISILSSTYNEGTKNHFSTFIMDTAPWSANLGFNFDHTPGVDHVAAEIPAPLITGSYKSGDMMRIAIEIPLPYEAILAEEGTDARQFLSGMALYMYSVEKGKVPVTGKKDSWKYVGAYPVSMSSDGSTIAVSIEFNATNLLKNRKVAVYFAASPVFADNDELTSLEQQPTTPYVGRNSAPKKLNGSRTKI